MKLKQQFILIGSILSLALFVWTAPVQASEPEILIDVVEIVDPAPFITHEDILPGDFFLHPMTVKNLTETAQPIVMSLDIDLSKGKVSLIPFELEERIFVKIKRLSTASFLILPGPGADTEATLQELDDTFINLGTIGTLGTENYEITFVFDPTAGNEYQNTKTYFNVAINVGVLDTLARLQIEKTNDSTGPQLPGDIVTYTLKVTALDNDVNDVVLTDLPPEGFAYIPGSESGAPLINPYASPGVWDLGDMAEGETKTVAYRTRISGTQDEGLYRDLAWAKGTADIVGSILAFDPIDSDNFVGTQVAVAIPTSERIALEEREETETEEKKKVLSVTTYLPATGTNSIWIILAGFLAALGGSLMYLGHRKKIQDNSSIKTIMKVFILALFGLALFGFSEIARAATPDPNISVRIEDPKSPNNTGTFKIGFVTLDIQGRDLSAQCYEETAGQIVTEYNHQNGGNSGNCAVNLLADGLYKFYVIASFEGDSTKSALATVEIKSGTPGTPFNYDRDGDSCSLSFTTANDGLTVKVELYRSQNNEFAADSSTFSTSIAVGPNTSGSINDPLGNCDDYLYAIRAVSAAGIGSGFVGDEEVNVGINTITTNVTNETIVRTGGAIPTTGGGGGAEAPPGPAGGAAPGPTPEAPPLFDIISEPIQVCQGWPLWVWILALIIFTLNFWRNARKNYRLEEYGWKVALAWTAAGAVFWYYFDFCREYRWFLYSAIIIAIVSHFVYLYYLRKKINEIEKIPKTTGNKFPDSEVREYNKDNKNENQNKIIE